MNNSTTATVKRTNSISPREQEILHLIAHEHTSKEIASELYISTETVLSHRRNIMHKMNVRNVAGMVRVGMERGLVGMVVLLLLFLVTNVHAQQLILDGDGTSERLMVIRNEGNVNSHTYYTAINASDQINTTPTYEGWRSRGTLDNQQDVMSGDRILLLMGLPYINGNYRSTSAIEFWVGSMPGPNSHPTYITISTTDNNKTVRQERLRVSENGNLGVGSSNPQAKVHVQNGDVYIEDINSGIILNSGNGCYRVTVDTNGSLVTTAITCP